MVKKIETKVIAYNLTKEYGFSDPFVGVLIDDMGEPLLNKDVSVIVSNIRDIEYVRTTNENGFFKLGINLLPGEYPIRSVFKGDSKYDSSEYKNIVTVLEPEPVEEEEIEEPVEELEEIQEEPEEESLEELEEELRNDFDEGEWDEVDDGMDKFNDFEEVEVSNEIIMDVKHIDMRFDLSKERVDNLKEYVIKAIKHDLPPKDNFKALDDVSFTVHKGERLGVIGFNGAGKSTLLKILSGVMKPTEGDVIVNGNVAPLLELGAGFDHNYSGSENIFLNGAILGYKKEFLETKYDEIVEFSELEEFIDVPIKNYSSGMIAKLGFSIATIVEPDILILDEVLSVGDVKFQKKSANKIKSLMKSGVTVVLVSHSVSTIRKICNKAIWLDHGELLMYGDVDEVCDAYVDAASKASAEELHNLNLD